jgi:hypothetical protein
MKYQYESNIFLNIFMKFFCLFLLRYLYENRCFMELSDRIKRINKAKMFINALASAILRNNVSDRTEEIKSILSDMKDSDVDWDKDVIGHYRHDYNDCMRDIEKHLNVWKTKNMSQGFKLDESTSKSDYTEAKEALMKSKSISAEMKERILKYLTSGSTYKEGGHIHGLTKPKELMNKTPKADGVSMGADKNGFFVYTHRARSDSHEFPEKIPVKEINFIESTG